ncbi:MAG: ATP-binding protein [Phycicoccus sp.]
MTWLPRIVEPAIEAALPTTPVVVLEGGRAIGKSTVCDRLVERHGWATRVDLSDPGVLASLRLDPVRFLQARATPCVVDEAQLEPEITVWVKRVVDQRRANGQFILTGSARLGRQQLGGSDPLAGRAVRISMSSMTQRELRSESSDFIERAFGAGWDTDARESAPDSNTTPHTWRGGIPALAGVLQPASAAQWERGVAAYVEAAIPLGAMGTRADTGRLQRSFRYLAANSGQLLNIARMASDLTMQANTARAQLDMLEAAFLMVRVEAERPAEHRVLTAHPRMFAADVGLAAWAARAWSGQVSAAVRGALTETLVAHDIVAQANASAERILVRHWRDTAAKREIDLLLVHPDGRLVALEVKASTSVGPGDTAGLRTFMRAEPERCVRGVVVYEGDTVVDLSPGGEDATVVALPRSMI